MTASQTEIKTMYTLLWVTVRYIHKQLHTHKGARAWLCINISPIPCDTELLPYTISLAPAVHKQCNKQRWRWQHGGKGILKCNKSSSYIQKARLTYTTLTKLYTPVADRSLIPPYTTHTHTRHPCLFTFGCTKGRNSSCNLWFTLAHKKIMCIRREIWKKNTIKKGGNLTHL